MEPRHSHSVYEKWLEAAERLGLHAPGNALVVEQSDRGDDRVEIQTAGDSKVTWDKIGFRYVDNHVIQVQRPGQAKPQKFSFSELGFENKITKMPTGDWALLIEAIRSDGTLPREESIDRKSARKTAKWRIKEKLCRELNISDDPFEPYRRNIGWKLKPKILEPLTRTSQGRFEDSMTSTNSISEREFTAEEDQVPARKVSHKNRTE